MEKDCAINIIVGLGNYGAQFNGTRHNVGFRVLDHLNSRDTRWNAGEHGLWCIDKFNNAILIKPITGMNASGLAIADGKEAVCKNSSYNIIIIHDDMDFDPGEVRVKFAGGAGNHNGVKSIIQHVGEEFSRVRVGIGKPIKGKGIDHVLTKFNAYERKLIDDATIIAAEAVVWIMRDGINKAMSKFNRKDKSE